MRWSMQSVSMGWLRTAAGAEQTCSARGETRLMPLCGGWPQGMMCGCYAGASQRGAIAMRWLCS